MAVSGPLILRILGEHCSWLETVLNEIKFLFLKFKGHFL
jgi:hypothetical protein